MKKIPLLFLLTAIGVFGEPSLTSGRVEVFLQALDDLKPLAATIPDQIPQETEKEVSDPFGNPFALRLSLLADKPEGAAYLAKKGLKKADFTDLAQSIWKTWLAVRLSEDKEYQAGLAQLQNAWQSPKTTSEEKLILRQRWEELRVLSQFKPKDKDAILPRMKDLNALFEGSL